jgi:hypothetical protein
MRTATPPETLSREKQQAYDLMSREFLRIGNKWQQLGEDQLDLMRQRRDMEELWRLAGFGDPPKFAPTMPQIRSNAG